MPLLEITQTPSRQRVDSAHRFDCFASRSICCLAKAPANNVVEEALKHVFAKDRDFQEYLKSPEAQRITPTLRVRRGNANDGAETSTKKPVSAAPSASQTPAIVAGSKA